MLVVFYSMTGKVARFIRKIGIDGIEIDKSNCKNLKMNKPFVLITSTHGDGIVPQTVLDFLSNNHTFLKGVSSSGNQNFGNNYGKAADIISQMYNVPVISKFELSGNSKDVDYFKQRMESLYVRKSSFT